jgi:hypothetical protein
MNARQMNAKNAALRTRNRSKSARCWAVTSTRWECNLLQTDTCHYLFHDGTHFVFTLFLLIVWQEGWRMGLFWQQRGQGQGQAWRLWHHSSILHSRLRKANTSIWRVSKV